VSLLTVPLHDCLSDGAGRDPARAALPIKTCLPANP
jgi:hypothetical protein